MEVFVFRFLEIFFGLMALYLFLSMGATYLLIHPSRLREKYTPKSYGLPYTPVHFFSMDGRLKLDGWLLRHDQATRGMIIFCHGLGSGKASFLPLAAYFFRNNFDCLLFDFRAHGESEGFFSTLGFEEKKDVLGALQYVEANHLVPDGKSILVGISMGASAALLACAESQNVKALISDSAFADGELLLQESFKVHFYGLPKKCFYKMCRFLLQLFAGKAESLKHPLQAASEIRVPVFFIHGEKDLSIPVHHVHDLFQACVSQEKELWIVPDSGHIEAFQSQTEFYGQKVLEFLEKYVEKKILHEQGESFLSASTNGIVEVAAGVLVENGKVLVTRRLKGVHLEGLWEFPGGKLKEGETPQLGLIREIREELNVEVIVEDLLAKVDYAYPDRKTRIYFFKCRILKGKPKPLRSKELRWIGKEELEQLTFPPANATVISKIKTILP
jgi:mutator protein MutT